MKKILLALSLTAIMIFSAACGNQSATSESGKTLTNSGSTISSNSETAEKKTVTVTTSFLYDMVRVLAGDLVNTELIIPAGEDPHLYLAKSGDLQKIQKADLLLYHGMHFEGKMQEALESKGYAVSETFSPDKIGTMDEDGEIIQDPHFWFNIELYKEAVQNAAAKLQELLPENKQLIGENLESYLKELTELDEENRQMLAQIPQAGRYLITPHDAFNYFSRSYDIPVMAPQGVSTDSEVANKDIEDTVNFIVEHKIKAIFAESTTDPARMEKLREACKQKGFDVKVVSGDGMELFSDSLAPEGEFGDTYIDMYRHNIKLIVENLK